jgi:hypothetical protein
LRFFSKVADIVADYLITIERLDGEATCTL